MERLTTCMSEIPYLKNKENQQGSGTAMVRVGEAKGEDQMLEMVVDDLMKGLERKDRQLVIDAITAFCHLIQDEDVEHDA